jgi:hypothetical protein
MQARTGLVLGGWLVATEVQLCEHVDMCFLGAAAGSCLMVTTTVTAVIPVRSTACSYGTRQAQTTWCWQTCKSSFCVATHHIQCITSRLWHYWPNCWAMHSS